ncbi:MAG: hypothetical protein NVS3B16_05050 [Vulcanimicrobiaceae bacterium]
MSNLEFLSKARGRVTIDLIDGTTHTGHFRESLLSPTALAAYFHGDRHDMSLPLDAIERVVAIDGDLQLAS